MVRVLIVTIALLAAAGAMFAAVPAGAADITLRGASEFGEEHPVSRTLYRFEQLVEEYYDGDRDVEFILHTHGDLGLGGDYFESMRLGAAVDYAIVAPWHMSRFSAMAALMDAPFLFSGLDHWNEVLDSDALDPIAEDVYEMADVLLIGYAGGSTRNLIVNRPVTNTDELQGLSVRVAGVPIQNRIFEAIGAVPTVIAFDEVYTALGTAVIEAAELTAMALEQTRFYEVAPYISLTRHTITVRPLAFSGKTFRSLPEDLQEAILRAGREAGAYGREIESTEDRALLQELAEEGWVKLHPFEDRRRLFELAEPVMRDYAEQLGASVPYINAVVGNCCLTNEVAYPVRSCRSTSGRWRVEG